MTESNELDGPVVGPVRYVLGVPDTPDVEDWNAVMGRMIALPADPPRVAEMVRAFHVAFGHPVHDTLRTPAIAQERLRYDLLKEEFLEYADAVSTGDRVGIADALADMIYVIYGTALVYGIDLDRVLEEVHRSNMSKLGEDGRPIYREDGKVLKGPNYEPPRIAAVLGLDEEA